MRNLQILLNNSVILTLTKLTNMADASCNNLLFTRYTHIYICFAIVNSNTRWLYFYIQCILDASMPVRVYENACIKP